MNLLASAIQDFGRRLGLPDLRQGQNGGVDLTIERVGRLQIEPRDEWVLVTLARPRPEHAERAMRTALKLCHWREGHAWPMHAGAKGDELMTFTACVRLGDFDVPCLENVIGCLSGLLDRVEKAG